MLGATDKRVDAVVASITWNDLAEAFFPSTSRRTRALDPGQLDPSATPGPFKQLWASPFFAAATAGAARSGTGGAASPTGVRTVRPDGLPALPRARPRPAPRARTCWPCCAPTAHARCSPGSRRRPMLVQGMTDSLFGLDQADATARTLAAQGTPVAVRWMDGGHDGAAARRPTTRTSVRGPGWTTTSPADGASRARSAGCACRSPPFVFATPIPRRQTAAPLLEAGDLRRLVARRRPSRSTRAPRAGPSHPPGGQPASITDDTGRVRPPGPRGGPADLPARRPARTVRRVRHRRPLTAADPGGRRSRRPAHRHVDGDLGHPLPQPVAGDRRRPDAPAPARRSGDRPDHAGSADHGRHRAARGDVDRFEPAARCGCSSRRPTRRMPIPATARADLDLPRRRRTHDSGRRRHDVRRGVGRRHRVHRRRHRHRRRAARADRARLVAPAAPPRHAAARRTSPTSRSSSTTSSRPTRTATAPSTTSRGAPNAARSSACSAPTAPARRRRCGWSWASSARTPAPSHVLGAAGHAPVPPSSPGSARSIEGPGFLPHLTGRQNLHAYWAATGRPESPRPATTRRSTSPRSAAPSTARCAPTATA